MQTPKLPLQPTHEQPPSSSRRFRSWGVRDRIPPLCVLGASLVAVACGHGSESEPIQGTRSKAIEVPEQPGGLDCGMPRDIDVIAPTAGLPIEVVDHAALGKTRERVHPAVQQSDGDWRALVSVGVYDSEKTPRTQLKLFTTKLSPGAAAQEVPLPFPSAYEVWTTLEHNGRAYLATNVPARLMVFDPDASTVQAAPAAPADPADGQPFDNECTTLFSMDAEGEYIALGGAQNCSRVALYDVANDAFIKFPDLLGPAYTYVYYVDLVTQHGARWLYAAVRGNKSAGVPEWAIVALNTDTRASHLIEVWPDEGLANTDKVTGIRDGWLAVQEGSGSSRYYRLQDGAAASVQASLSTPTTSRPSITKTVTPSATDGSSSLTLAYALPDDETGTVVFDIPEQPVWVQRAVRWDADTLAITTGPTGPLARVDRAADGTLAQVTELGQMPDLSSYAMAVTDDGSGSLGVVTGYPSLATARFDLDLPPGDSNMTNVENLATLPNVEAHSGVAAVVGVHGKVWLVGLRHRFSEGFDVVRYDPATGEAVRFDDGGAFDDLNLVAAFGDGPVGNGRFQRLRIVAQKAFHPNDAEGQRPGLVFTLNTGLNWGAGGFSPAPFRPLPDEWDLGPLTSVASSNKLIGLAYDQARTTTRVYWMHPGFGHVVRCVDYNGIIGGTGVLYGPSGGTRHGPGFVEGPDQQVWTTYRLGNVAEYPHQIIRIDNGSLHSETIARTDHVSGISSVGRTPRFLFDGSDLYLTGDRKLRVIRDAVP